MLLTGYVPKNSGATIASGYDIGNGPDISSCVGSSIWAKLRPYRGHKTPASLNAAGLVASNLKVTYDEVTILQSRNRVVQYCCSQVLP